MTIRSNLLIGAFLLHGLFVFGQSWSLNLPGLGTFSSPRCIDLNQDGILDIVVGAGREEFQRCDSAILAIDGRAGTVLWKAPASDQIFGSALFGDIDQDQIPDIVIGGRSAELFALSGKNGSLIWSFKAANQIKKPGKQGWFNFYNPQWISDQNGDGYPDLIVSNGGDVLAEPHDPDRPPGQLVILNGRNGELLARAMMPDHKEIYMSILVIPSLENDHVIFGTGGETIGGNLWITTISSVVEENLTQAQLLDSSAQKGYIGPPVAADINEDGVFDIICNSVDGRLMAFDGLEFNKVWEVEVPETESYSSFTVGHFDQDEIPDFFISVGRGVWPRLGWSIQQMISGATGEVLFTDSLGFYQNTAALAFDVNGDGLDEIMMSLNFQEVNQIFQKFFYTMLVTINFESGSIEKLGPTYQGSNLSSTPWIGDLDGDDELDIIHCHGTNLRHTYTFDGMTLHRIATELKIHKPVLWGSYQGSAYNGLFLRPRN